MDNTKFTKGKWELKDCTIRNPNRNADKGNIFDIAQCFTGFNQNATREECKANALLISKAPEMLEMLKDVFDLLNPVTDEQGVKESYYQLMPKIEQLIKEATEL